jgi:hypothetical protein
VEVGKCEKHTGCKVTSAALFLAGYEVDSQTGMSSISSAHDPISATC